MQMNRGVSVRLNGFFVFVFATTMLSSCAFVPEVSDTQEYYAECPMLTKKLTLNVTNAEGELCDEDDDIKACLVFMGAVLPVGSLIVSGSLVLAGNTLHWLEYEVSCENGVVLKNYNKLKSKLNKT